MRHSLLLGSPDGYNFWVIYGAELNLQHLPPNPTSETYGEGSFGTNQNDERKKTEKRRGGKEGRKK